MLEVPTTMSPVLIVMESDGEYFVAMNRHEMLDIEADNAERLIKALSEHIFAYFSDVEEAQNSLIWRRSINKMLKKVREGRGERETSSKDDQDNSSDDVPF